MMRLTIIGFGNQARAWAQNLQDSHFPVRVALRPDSSSFESAIKLGLDVVEIGSEDFFKDKHYVLLTPDDAHHEFMLMYAHRFEADTTIFYNHGFSLTKYHFEKHFPHLNHVLFAVKAIGAEIRRQYLLKGKLGAVYSLEHVKGDTEVIHKWMKHLAHALGLNMGLYKTSFQNETQADLYSEQGLLCSIVPYAASAVFDHLVESGIEPELAYFECWHELKLIVDAMVEKGPEGFYDLISPNALVGSEKGFEKLMTPELDKNLRSLLTDIQTGTFNKELEEVSVEDLRKKIRNRWANSQLMKTFKEMNRDKK